MFENKQHHAHRNRDNQAHHNAFGPGGPLDVSGFLKVHNTLLRVSVGLLYIEVNSIQDSALFDHEYWELFEKHCQIVNVID